MQRMMPGNSWIGQKDDTFYSKSVLSQLTFKSSNKIAETIFHTIMVEIMSYDDWLVKIYFHSSDNPDKDKV